MSVLDYLSSSWSVIFIVVTLCILLFTDLSIEKIMVVLALVASAIFIYKSVLSSTSMLTIGLLGIIFVLLFALASGVGRSQAPVIIKQDCDPKNIIKPPPKKTTLNCPLSSLDPAGNCPSGYTNFTDGEGNTLCCASSNIDPYSHKCPAAGPNGICSMAPGLEDIRSPSGDKIFYPLCQNVTKDQVAEKGNNLCPSKFPNYLQLGGNTNNYKCCSMYVTNDATDCPDPSKACTGLFGGQTIFNTPTACESLKFQAGLTCPDGTTFNTQMPVKDPKSGNVTYPPACNGVTNTCYPKSVLQKCVDMGKCSAMNLDKSLSNCDVFNALFNTKTMDFSTIDITPVDFFN